MPTFSDAIAKDVAKKITPFEERQRALITQRYEYVTQIAAEVGAFLHFVDFSKVIRSRLHLGTTYKNYPRNVIPVILWHQSKHLLRTKIDKVGWDKFAAAIAESPEYQNLKDVLHSRHQDQVCDISIGAYNYSGHNIANNPGAGEGYAVAVIFNANEPFQEEPTFRAWTPTVGVNDITSAHAPRAPQTRTVRRLQRIVSAIRF